MMIHCWRGSNLFAFFSFVHCIRNQEAYYEKFALFSWGELSIRDVVLFALNMQMKAGLLCAGLKMFCVLLPTSEIAVTGSG